MRTTPSPALLAAAWLLAGCASFGEGDVHYDGDERVIGLITRGIGQPETAAVVEERCSWLEVGEDLR